jgi:hypothetical protein
MVLKFITTKPASPGTLGKLETFLKFFIAIKIKGCQLFKSWQPYFFI